MNIKFKNCSTCIKWDTRSNTSPYPVGVCTNIKSDKYTKIMNYTGCCEFRIEKFEIGEKYDFK